ncbi:MAG: hypothetical protein ACKO9H_07500, partial [Planctomycetota bacterium]
MSWRKINLKARPGVLRHTRAPLHPSTGWVAALVCTGMFLCGATSRLSAQENPLREGDAGYLQQLLPSL